MSGVAHCGSWLFEVAPRFKVRIVRSHGQRPKVRPCIGLRRYCSARGVRRCMARDDRSHGVAVHTDQLGRCDTVMVRLGTGSRTRCLAIEGHVLRSDEQIAGRWNVSPTSHTQPALGAPPGVRICAAMCASTPVGTGELRPSRPPHFPARST